MKSPTSGPSLHGTGAAKLAVLLAAGQALLLLLSPALARLYPPDALGQFAVFSALVAIGAYVATLRFDQVIVVARGAPQARRSAAVGFVSAAAVTLALGLATAAGLDALLTRAFGAGAQAWSGYLAPCILFAAIAALASGWLLRNGRLGAVGIVRLAQTGLVAILGVAFGLGGVTDGLIAAVVAGLLLTVGAAAALAHDVAGARWPSIARLCGVARRYRVFALKGTPAALVNALGLYLPLLLFGQIFGDEENGRFALARQCLLGVYAVLGVSTAQAFTLACTTCVREGGSLSALLVRQLRRQGVIAAVLLLGTWLFAEPLFGWVFGERWLPAGAYAAWLAIPVAALLLVTPLSGLLLAVERIGANSAWQTARTLGLAALALFPFSGPMAFLAAFAAVEVVFYAAYLALIAFSAAAHDRRPRR